ncbi:hypothetical protein HQ590_04580 [bacterium]|nr:hypothetical protein [bacterium]
MNRSHRCWFAAFITLVIAALPCLGQVTSDVYEASISGSLAGFNDTVDPPQLITQKIFTAPIINVARDRSPLGLPPANEILALTVSREDSPSIQLIVWDTNTQSNLVTIAESDAISGGDNGKKGVLVTLLDINDTGGVTQTFLDGFLALSGSYKPDAEGRPAGFKASVLGVIAGRIEGITGDAMLTKGKIKAAKTPLGVLVE